jgi:hypothetical protein
MAGVIIPREEHIAYRKWRIAIANG